MSDWNVNISKVDNGFLFEPSIDSETDKKVFEYQNDEEDDLDAVQRMLYEVLEFFAIFNSKYNKRRIEINVVDNPKSQ